MIIELLIKCGAWTPGSELQGKTKLYNGSRSTSDSAATYFYDYLGQSRLRPGLTWVSLVLRSPVLMGGRNCVFWGGGGRKEGKCGTLFLFHAYLSFSPYNFDTIKTLLNHVCIYMFT